jgi:hypothetical protein
MAAAEMLDAGTMVSALFRYKGALNLPRAALTIGGGEVKFFKDALRQGCRFFRLATEVATNVDIWQLEFFADTRFACTMFVIARPLGQNEELDQVTSALFNELALALGVSASAGLLIDSGRVIWQSLPFDATSVAFASKYMRGTISLTALDFEERGGRRLSVEPRGLALISNANNVAFIFQRYCMLLALLRAYQYAIDSAVDSLAELAAQPASSDASAKMSALRRDSLVFAARFLFAHPVRLDTVDLRFVWARLSEVNHLRETHAELSEQLDAVHSLLLHDEEKRDDAREKRGQYWLTLIGLMLAMLSLLSLVDVTPEKLREFWHAWVSG